MHYTAQCRLVLTTVSGILENEQNVRLYIYFVQTVNNAKTKHKENGKALN